jgi:hypothetical protein
LAVLVAVLLDPLESVFVLELVSVLVRVAVLALTLDRPSAGSAAKSTAGAVMVRAATDARNRGFIS